MNKLSDPESRPHTRLLAWVRDEAEAALVFEEGADAIAMLGSGPDGETVSIQANHGIEDRTGKFVSVYRAATTGPTKQPTNKGAGPQDGEDLFGFYKDRLPGLDDLDRLRAGGAVGIFLDWTGRLVEAVPRAALAEFIRSAQDRRLTVALSGGIEAPDVPRLLPLRPDFLACRRAIRIDGRLDRPLDRAALNLIRGILPRHGGPDTPEPERPGAAPVAEQASKASRPPDRIFVRDFVLPVHIGLYAHEYTQAQRVRFSVEAEFRPVGGAAPDMRHIISYDLITDAIRDVVAAGHVELVEGLAEMIAERVLCHGRVQATRVTVEKLDIGPGSLGVEIWREAAS